MGVLANFIKETLYMKTADRFLEELDELLTAIINVNRNTNDYQDGVIDAYKIVLTMIKKFQIDRNVETWVEIINTIFDDSFNANDHLKRD